MLLIALCEITGDSLQWSWKSERIRTHEWSPAILLTLLGIATFNTQRSTGMTLCLSSAPTSAINPEVARMSRKPILWRETRKSFSRIHSSPSFSCTAICSMRNPRWTCGIGQWSNNGPLKDVDQSTAKYTATSSGNRNLKATLPLEPLRASSPLVATATNAVTKLGEAQRATRSIQVECTTSKERPRRILERPRTSSPLVATATNAVTKFPRNPKATLPLERPRA